jgi:four helix bundle protein
MGIRSLEDLLVYQDALEAVDAVSALIRRDALRRDCTLRRSLADAANTVASTIGEGFSQPSDHAFTHFLYRARGSCNEVRTHLAVARGRNYITSPECTSACDRYVRIGRRLTLLIQHLREPVG